MKQHPSRPDQALDVLRWAVDRYGSELVVTASFGDPTLVHLVATAAPGVDIALLDTGYLFAETEWYADDLRRRFDLDVRTVHPLPGTDGDVWRTDPTACCAARKIEPLERALRGKRAWVTGVRRADGPSRAGTAIVHDDVERGVVKINPLADWSDDDVAGYIAEHDLPLHPLADRGYRSIGCWPCTNPASDASDPRSGRWAGTDKTECGLHVSAAGAVPVAVRSAGRIGVLS